MCGTCGCADPDNQITMTDPDRIERVVLRLRAHSHDHDHDHHHDHNSPHDHRPDADRIRSTGARAIQINTGVGCHLEANMIASAVEALAPNPGALLLIENVGNLVCPAMFDLGERMKVAVISTPEGENKPLKYSHMFRAAEIVVINKIDLAPHVDFDKAACRANIAEINPTAEIICLSARTGTGMDVRLDRLLKLRGQES